MAWFSHLVPANRRRAKAAAALHEAVMTAARTPGLYRAGLAFDDFDGRFDMAVLHAVLVMRALREHGPEGQALAGALYERLFSGFDHALRETGTGDLRVGARMRELGEAYYGQARAIDAALSAPDPAAALGEMLARNEPRREAKAAVQLAAHVVDMARTLASLSPQDWLAGRVALPVFAEARE